MPKGAKAKAQKNPMPMMMPGMDCGISARYSTTLPKRKVERRATMTAMTARLLTRRRADAGHDEAVPDGLDVGVEGEDRLVVLHRQEVEGVAQRREDQGEGAEDEPQDRDQGAEDDVEER